MKLKPTSLLLLLLVLALVPALSRGRLINAKNNSSSKKDTGSEVYEIDYRGPETHTYIPPPNRVGDRPRIHHQASLARRKSKVNKARRNGKKVVG